MKRDPRDKPRNLEIEIQIESNLLIQINNIEILKHNTENLLANDNVIFLLSKLRHTLHLIELFLLLQQKNQKNIFECYDFKYTHEYNLVNIILDRILSNIQNFAFPHLHTISLYLF